MTTDTAKQSQSDGIAEWKREKRHVFWSRLIRWGVGIPLILFSYPWLGYFGPFLVLLGSILIAPDIAGYFAKFAGNIIWPHHKGKPQPIYGIPRSLAAKGRYAEAEMEYEKIIQEFPHEATPHIEMINIAVVRLNNPELAEQLYQRGMGLLKNPEARETLTRMYAALRSRLKSKDKENRKVIPHEKIEEIRDRLARDRDKLWQ
ncbi:MAG: tetratricopeptide repeat protein [Lentisphaerae bacterium]|nr:tetratricopeptide repeat protein [Lentisphaerota bacterium]